jgi:hypothetical protein
MILCNAVPGNELFMPHMNFTYLRVQWQTFAQTAPFMRIQSATFSSFGARQSSLTCAAFATEMLQRIDEDNGYLTRVSLSDEATFYTSGKINRHNVYIWGLESPRVVLENERESPKINVWCALMHNKVTGPFFFLSASFQQSFPWRQWSFMLHIS